MVISINKNIYSGEKPYTVIDASERWLQWCLFAEANKLNSPEYLLPTAEIETEISPFSYEVLADVTKPEEQLRGEMEGLGGGWNYQMEFKDRQVTTRGFRHEFDWRVHRYRGSLLIRNIVTALGTSYPYMTVLDVGCACGLFSLEFAYQGSANVTGLDLREGNIQQAKYLSEAYGIQNCQFAVQNARNLIDYKEFDIVFCAGLLYHVTFPLELIKSLFESCTDFVILDSNVSNHAISAFNVIMNRDISYAAEGEFSYEFLPNYRAVIDALLGVGFENIIELLGKGRGDVANTGYGVGQTRSFLAFKPGSKSYPVLRAVLNAR